MHKATDLSFTPITVVIADKSWIVRDAIAGLLCEIEPSCMIEAAPDRAELDRLLRSGLDPSFVFVGRGLVLGEEEALFLKIRELAPQAASGVFGSSFDLESVRKLIDFGAIAVISVDDTRQAVAQALRQMLAKEVVLPASSRLAEELPQRAELVAGRDLGNLGGLTPRERDVFALLGDGLSVPLIATRLLLSPHTVRVHIARIMKKLDLRDRSALMHRAVSHQAFVN